MTSPFDYAAEQASSHLDTLPHHMRGAMERYIFHGIMPGSFLSAVLSNDLMEAFGRADEINREHLWDYCLYLWNYAPAGSKGSPRAVEEWHKRGGLNGLRAASEAPP